MDNNNVVRYSLKEFAEKVGVSVRTVARLEKVGKLSPNRSLTGKKFYSEEHVKIFFGDT